MELFILELWRDDGLSCVRAHSPSDQSNLVGDDSLAQFVMGFSMAIKDLVDWENERVVYRDSDGDLIYIDGISGDGIMESVLDAAMHWPFVYKIQYEITHRPIKKIVKIVDEFPDVSFPEISKRMVIDMMEKKNELQTIPMNTMLSNDCFNEFLVQLEKRQEEIQHTIRMVDRESVSITPPPLSLPSNDPFEMIATETTRRTRRIVPGTPLEDLSHSPQPYNTTEPELNELVERVERQLSRLSVEQNATQTEVWMPTTRYESTPTKKDGRVVKYKSSKVDNSSRKKKTTPSEPKVVLLKMGKARQDLRATDAVVYTQSVRMINLSQKAINAKIVVDRRSPGARAVIYRDTVHLQPFCATKFAVGMVDDENEETSYVTYSLHLFNTPISPPFTIFSPLSSNELQSISYPMVQIESSSKPEVLPSIPSLALPPPPSLHLLPTHNSSQPIPAPPPPRVEALPAPLTPRVEAIPLPPISRVETLPTTVVNRVEALYAPPQIFHAQFLKNMITPRERTQSCEEAKVAFDVEEAVEAIVQEALISAETKEEEMKTPMFIIEETAEEVHETKDEEEEEEEEKEKEIDQKGDEEDEELDDTQVEDESDDEIEDVEEINVEDIDDSDDDSEFEVISSIEADH